MHVLNPHELPCKSGPVRVKVVTSECYIKLDLIEFIQVVDDISVQMGLQEGTAFIIPLTVNDKQKSLPLINKTGVACFSEMLHPVHFYKFSFSFCNIKNTEIWKTVFSVLIKYTK